MHKCINANYMRGQTYRCANDNRKENLGRSEIKRRKENTLCRHGEIQLARSKKKAKP